MSPHSALVSVSVRCLEESWSSIQHLKSAFTPNMLYFITPKNECLHFINKCASMYTFISKLQKPQTRIACIKGFSHYCRLYLTKFDCVCYQSPAERVVCFSPKFGLLRSSAPAGRKMADYLPTPLLLPTFFKTPYLIPLPFVCLHLTNRHMQVVSQRRILLHVKTN